MCIGRSCHLRALAASTLQPSAASSPVASEPTGSGDAYETILESKPAGAEVAHPEREVEA